MLPQFGSIAIVARRDTHPPTPARRTKDPKPKTPNLPAKISRNPIHDTSTPKCYVRPMATPGGVEDLVRGIVLRTIVRLTRARARDPRELRHGASRVLFIC